MRANMTAKNQTLNMINIAFPITDNFVKIGNLAYPIKHSFVVGERWVEDPNAPAILECYNTLPFFIGPLNFFPAAPAAGLNKSTISLTFAHAGLITGSVASGFITEHAYGETVHSNMFIIGQMPPIMPSQLMVNYPGTHNIQHFSGESKKKTNLAWRTAFDHDLTHLGDLKWNHIRPFEYPFMGFGSSPHPQWWVQGQSDVVFWIFDHAFYSSTYLSWFRLTNRFLHFDTPPYRTQGTFQELLLDTQYFFEGHSINHPYFSSQYIISDELFLPGQQGMRIISRKFWNAPWERYPHL